MVCSNVCGKVSVAKKYSDGINLRHYHKHNSENSKTQKKILILWKTKNNGLLFGKLPYKYTEAIKEILLLVTHVHGSDVKFKKFGRLFSKSVFKYWKKSQRMNYNYLQQFTQYFNLGVLALTL